MSEKKKTRPDAATSKRAKLGTHQTSGNPYNQFNTGDSGRQFKIEAEV